MSEEPRMVAIGDNCVDRYPRDGIAFPGGSCVNAAVFANRLGIRSAYIGVVGDDAAGDLLVNALTSEGVDVSRLRRTRGSTAITDVSIDDAGDRVFTAFTPASEGIGLAAEDFEFLEGSAWIHTGHTSGIEHELARLSALAPIAFDFSHRPLETAIPLVEHVTLATFSRDAIDDADCAALLRKSVAAGADMALVTRGAQGAMALVGGTIVAHPGLRIDAVDTIGAGDAFQTCFMSELLAGACPSGAIETATRFAAEVCMEHGAFGHAKRWAEHR